MEKNLKNIVKILTLLLVDYMPLYMSQDNLKRLKYITYTIHTSIFQWDLIYILFKVPAVGKVAILAIQDHESYFAFGRFE